MQPRCEVNPTRRRTALPPDVKSPAPGWGAPRTRARRARFARQRISTKIAGLRGARRPGLGYSTPKLFDMDAPHGGSPYGAGTLAGPDGSRQPSALEKDIAEAHGKHSGTIAAKLAK